MAVQQNNLCVRTESPFRSRDLRNGNKTPQDTPLVWTIQIDTGAVSFAE